MNKHINRVRDAPIPITGMGFHGAAGSMVNELQARFRAGQTAIRGLSLSERPEPSIGFGAFLEMDAVVPQIPSAFGSELTERIIKTADVTIRASAIAAIEAMGAASIAPERLGLVVGGSNLQHPLLFSEFQRFKENPSRINPRVAFEGLDTHLAAVIAMLIHARGPVVSVAAAAASGLHAAITAMDLIRLGRCDACLVIGAMQCPTLPEWRALAALGAINLGEEASLPLCEGGYGFTPGEAAACVLFEAETHAIARKARIHAFACGGAYVSAADPMPHASATDEARSMLLALDEAGLGIQDIDLVTLHATGTRQGDEAEISALQQVFDERLRGIWGFTPKSITGHCLTASGVVGLIASILMLEEQRIYPVPLGGIPRITAPKLVASSVAMPIVHTMTNAFGFGGFNASLILRR